ncbi:MAG: flagellin, partial [Verrucomicrobiota bacterium]|nr:flagellin [Verrucomicrobiota bacterium]
MPLTINTNIAAVTASYHLAKNNDAMQKSLARLSSGSKVTNSSDDAGGLAVSMKLAGSINRLNGVASNLQNAISFLEVQDGVLEAAGNIMDRMAELKSLYMDVLKSDSDKDNYNTEFKDLQMQLYQIAQENFNGVSLFAGTTGKVFATDNVTVSVYTSDQGA